MNYSFLIAEQSMLLVVRLTYNLVVVVNKEYHWLMSSSFFWCHVGIGHDDHLVTNIHTLGSSAVQADYARAFLAADGVCLKSVAIVDVNNLHLLILIDARLSQQFCVYRHAADVVKVSLRDGSTMYLCL